MDDFIKREIDSKGIPFKEEYWDAMEARLNEGMPVQQKSRKGYYIFILGLLAISGITAWIFLRQPDSQSTDKLTSSKTESVSKPQSSSSEKSEYKDRPSVSDSKPSPAPPSINKDFKRKLLTNIHPNPTAIKAQNIPDNIIPVQDVDIDPLPIESGTLWEPWFLKGRPFSAFSNQYVFPFPSTLSLPIRNPSAFSWYAGVHSSYRIHQIQGGVSNFSKNLPGMNNGIDLSVKKGHWNLVSGLELASYRIQTNYSVSTESHQIESYFKMVNRNYTQSPRGSRVALITQVNDTNTTRTSSVQCQNCEVEFNYVNIPLFLQYEIGKRRTGLYVSGGMIASRLTSASGQYALTDRVQEINGVSGFELESLENSDKLNKWMMMTGFGMGIRHRLSPKADIKAGYSRYASLGSMFKQTNHTLLSQNYSVALSYRIKWRKQLLPYGY